jgi:hypothetical protein
MTATTSIISSPFPTEWNLPPTKNLKKYSTLNITRVIKKINAYSLDDCLEFTGKCLNATVKKQRMPVRHFMYSLFCENPKKGYIVEQICKHVSVCVHPSHLILIPKTKKNKQYMLI